MRRARSGSFVPVVNLWRALRNSPKTTSCMALPRRMQLAIRSGARVGRRSKCCEDVYSETTRASYDRVFWTEYTAESTTAHPPHSLVSGWTFAGPRLTSLPWPCSLRNNLQGPPSLVPATPSYIRRPQLCRRGYRRCSRGGGGGSWGGLRRQFRCFRHCLHKLTTCVT
jgi:hypothetical protein